MSKEIQNFRKKFDNLDTQILNLLNKRNQLSKEIGEYKNKNNLSVQDKKREKQILATIQEKAEKNNLDKKYIKQIFKAVLRSSRKIQKDKK
jgi:chorismate mutase-like protein